VSGFERLRALVLTCDQELLVGHSSPPVFRNHWAGFSEQVSEFGDVQGYLAHTKFPSSLEPPEGPMHKPTPLATPGGQRVDGRFTS
jgi:hypothetical protein